MRIVLPTLLLSLGLVACSSSPSCLRSEPYQKAQEFPPLREPAGLSVPQPDPNMQIPEVAEGPVGAFPRKDAEDNKEQARQRCLSSPPPLDEQA